MQTGHSIEKRRGFLRVALAVAPGNIYKALDCSRKLVLRTAHFENQLWLSRHKGCVRSTCPAEDSSRANSSSKSLPDLSRAEAAGRRGEDGKESENVAKKLLKTLLLPKPSMLQIIVNET
jgi:hypothetical protein